MNGKVVRAVLEPVVARYQGRNLRRYFRADAAFANPELYEYLEAEGFEYAIRLPGNDALLRDIEPLLTRPVEQKENHEKGQRGSRARNQMGNPSLPMPANKSGTGKTPYIRRNGFRLIILL